MKKRVLRFESLEDRQLLAVTAGLEAAAALPAPGAPLRILYLGQLIRGKGADLLLEALRLLTLPWRASIVGDGGDRGMLEAAAARYGIADRVGFTGWRSDPEKCFAEHDVAVFPSRWQEPFGLSGAEAQAHGLPVVGFDVGGGRETRRRKGG